MSESLISLKKVCAGYNGTTILENIDLEVNKGDFLGIIGPNGGGKTTLLKVILGILKPYSGEVLVYGQNPMKLKGESRHKIGYVPQEKGMDTGFPVHVRDAVLMGAYAKAGTFRKVSAEQIKAGMSMLERVGMQDYSSHAIGALSGGQKQRVLIARALISRPELLVLDEPTTGVDTQNQTNLRQLLVELKIEFDLTLLMVSHDTGMIAGQVNKISCVNRSSHIHGSLESIMQHASEIEEAGCDIEAIARQQFMYKDLSGGGHG